MRTLRVLAALLILVGVAGCGYRASVVRPGTVAGVSGDRTVTSSTPSGERTAIVHHPASAKAGAPLVIVLHGALGTGEQARKDYGWDGVADRDGVVVAYPDGLGRAWAVNPACCGRPHNLGVDDVAYLHQLRDELVRADGVDAKRVYAVGISNGAMLAYSWACAKPGELAGIGPVAGSLVADCVRPAPITVAAVHGTADHNVPINGGVGPRGISGLDNPPLERTLEKFRAVDGCPPGPAAPDGAGRDPATGDSVDRGSAPAAGGVHQRFWTCTTGHVVSVVIIDGAGHQWPGAPPLGPDARALGLDEPSTALNATDWLWTHLRDAARGGP